VWGALYEEAARGALAKLDNVLPEAQRHEVAWASRALVATNMSRAAQLGVMPILEKLRRATRERRRIRLRYRGHRPEPVTREVDVYALAYRWGWWYAVGHCHLRQAIRSFRVDRIDDLLLLSQLFDIPDEFAIHDYLAIEPPQRTEVEVTMRFAPEGAFLAEYGRAYWQRMETGPDGATTVTFAAEDMHVAASTALSYGPLVEVLAPQTLRGMAREWALAVAEKYHERDHEEG
jgi:predicted DNA-binding transcriptional regulator YafY